MYTHEVKLWRYVLFFRRDRDDPADEDHNQQARRHAQGRAAPPSPAGIAFEPLPQLGKSSRGRVEGLKQAITFGCHDADSTSFNRRKARFRRDPTVPTGMESILAI